MHVPPPPIIRQGPTWSRPHAAAPWILLAAVILGVAGNMLLRASPWGINIAVWLSALAAMAVLLPRIDRLELRAPRGSGWLVAAMCFSLLFGWRSSAVLQALNTVGVLFCFSMVAFRNPSGIRRAGLVQYAANVTLSCAETLAGAVALVLRNMDWRGFRERRQTRHLRATAIGLAIALPLLGVFGGLFAAADSNFSSLLKDSLPLSAGEAFSHLALALLFTWLAGSYLWSALLSERPHDPAAIPLKRPAWLKLEAIETGLIFGALNVLFLAFVAVQFRYLFGGDTHVAASETLTYSSYARRGFFELVTVAALIVPVLLTGHWLLARGRAGLERAFVFLAGGLVVLVFVVMASALERMRLYQDAFGLTELRLYSTAFMAWLFLVLAWFAATVLRGQRERFASGAAASALVMIVALNALNPDALIIRRNAAADRPFDASYALDLSPDAVPALLVVDLPEPERCRVVTSLASRRDSWSGDWRSWNWSRWRAARAIDRATACP